MSEKIFIPTKDGHVRGIKQVTQFSGTQYYSFFGIPYGKPPINNLRYKDPESTKPWKDIHDGTYEREGCIQFSYKAFQITGTEDCLYNDIHIPKLPKKGDALRAVIVNIHPGAYGFGTTRTNLFGSPEFVMHHDIVYVNISYRLHILGFLNLQLKECSGNQGIKDIVLSLRWIKNNIRSFGGDPDNITLLGSSSGSTIIHAIMLSSVTRDLFHKVVMMSGYVQVASEYRRESNEGYAREIAKNLGYGGDLQNHTKLLSFLKKQDPALLITESRRCQKALQQTIAPIFPIPVFSTSLDRGDILSESPRKLTESMARIPIMTGFSQIESALGFVKTTRPLTEKYFKNSLRQSCFGWGYHLNDNDVESIFKEVERFYLNGQPIDQAPVSTKMDIQTDIVIFDAYNMVINPIAEHLPSSVFVYKFEFMGNMLSMTEAVNVLSTEKLNKTVHASDFPYWNRAADPRDTAAREMIKTFTKLITTFAKTGDPNYENFPIKWRSSTPEEPCYLSINHPFEMVKGKVNHDRSEFWNDIKKKYTTD